MMRGSILIATRILVLLSREGKVDWLLFERSRRCGNDDVYTGRKTFFEGGPRSRDDGMWCYPAVKETRMTRDEYGQIKELRSLLQARYTLT